MADRLDGRGPCRSAGGAAQHVPQGPGAGLGAGALPGRGAARRRPVPETTTTAPGWSRLCPASPSQERKALSCDTHPSLRAVWMWGETAPARERPQPGPVRHLPAVWMWGETASARTWAGAIADLLGRAERVPDERFDAAAGAVEPQDPMVVIYTSGSTSEPKGVVHSHATVGRPPVQPAAVPGSGRHRRAVHAHAAVLGRGPVLHAGQRHACGRHGAVRGALRAGRHPGSDRTAPGDPRDRLAPHGQGPRGAPVVPRRATCRRSGAAASTNCCPRTCG